MSKLNINPEEFSNSFQAPAQSAAGQPMPKEKKENTGELTECVRISAENKYALKKLLLQQEEKTGKSGYLNRLINNILTEYLESHKNI